jgi:glycosyltransferase involved in cell wall biosynthesis
MRTTDFSVSVVIPIYNSKETLHRALKSVINQTKPVDEIILINDGSTDESEEIVLEFQKEHPNYDWYYEYQKNAGPAKTRNKGIEKAKSSYIAFLDADDAWLNSKIEKQMSIFSNPKNNDLVLLGGYNTLNTKKEGWGYISFSQLLLKNYFLTSSVMAKRDTLLEVGGFPEDQKYSEDYALWLAIASEYPVAIVKESIFIYAQGDEGINSAGLSSRFWKMEKGELRNYKRLLSQKKISIFHWIFLNLFSLIKYLSRRLLK